MAKRGKQKQKQKGKPATASPVDETVQSAASAADASTAAEAASASTETGNAVDDENPAPVEAAAASDRAASADDAQPETAADEAETVAEIEAGSPDIDTQAPESHASESAPKPKRPRRIRARDARSPFLVLADYEQRSLAHVAGLPEQLDAPGLWRGVAYRIGTRRLASGFDEVLEILPMPAVTHIPGSTPWMLGVANIRGTLLPVIDLKQFLEGERTVLQEKQRVLVVHQPGGDVAVTIDELYGQRSFVDAQSVDAAAIADGRYAYFVEHAYRYGDHDWGVFSLSRLARTPEFRQAAA